MCTSLWTGFVDNPVERRAPDAQDGDAPGARRSTPTWTGRALSLPVTAEGIETDRIREKLERAGNPNGWTVERLLARA